MQRAEPSRQIHLARCFIHLAITVLFMHSACPEALAADTPKIEVGSPFPDLVLPSLDGSRMRVSDFRGEKVFLHVFASW